MKRAQVFLSILMTLILISSCAGRDQGLDITDQEIPSAPGSIHETYTGDFMDTTVTRLFARYGSNDLDDIWQGYGQVKLNGGRYRFYYEKDGFDHTSTPLAFRSSEGTPVEGVENVGQTLGRLL